MQKEASLLCSLLPALVALCETCDISCFPCSFNSLGHVWVRLSPSTYRIKLQAFLVGKRSEKQDPSVP